MPYYTVYHANGTDAVDSGDPFDFGTLSIDDEAVSEWQLGIVKTDAGLVSTGDSTVTVVDSTGADSSDLFQLAAFTAGDTTEPAATPAAYGADLTLATGIDDTTGRSFWVRRKAGSGESPATDTTAVVRVTGTVIPE